MKYFRWKWYRGEVAEHSVCVPDDLSDAELLRIREATYEQADWQLDDDPWHGDLVSESTEPADDLPTYVRSPTGKILGPL